LEFLKQSVGQVWKVVHNKRSRRRSKKKRATEQCSGGCYKTQPVSQQQESVETLIEMTSDYVNGLNHQAQEWEEIEFPVDSGASVTVVGEEAVRAVQAESPNRERQYKLADGSFIPHKGSKTFKAVTDLGLEGQLTASVTDVVQPLLSVAQVVRSWPRVVFDKNGSYIEDENKERIPLESRGGMHTLKMWVPRDQSDLPLFQSQASNRP